MTTSAGEVFWAPGLLERIVSFMTPNDVACNVRLVNRSTAQRFRAPEHRTMHLSQPCSTEAFRQRWSGPGAVRSMNMKRRRQLVCLTAASGVLGNLEVALAAAECVPRHTMMEAAAAAGQLESCTWLRARGCPWGDALPAAAQAGHWAVCERLLDSGCPWHNAAPMAAAKAGRLELMERLCQLAPAYGGKVYQVALLAAAAEGFDLPTLQQVYDSHSGDNAPGLYEFVKSGMLMAAALASPIPDWRAKMEWLEGLGCPRQILVSRLLWQPHAVERLTWLRQQGYTLEFPSVDEMLKAVCAAKNSSLLHFLVSEGLMTVRERFSVRMFMSLIAAAAKGHLAILQALHAANLLQWVMPYVIARAAARGGQLPVLVWAVEELGYDIASDAKVFLAAAESGDIASISWVGERNQIRSRADDMVSAVGSGCVEAMELVAGPGFVVPAHEAFAHRLVNVALCNGDLAALRWLQQRLDGTLPRSVFVHMVTLPERKVEILQWLIEEAGCPVDLETLGEAERQLAEKLEKVKRELQRATVQDTVLDWLREELRRRRIGEA